MNNMYQPLFFMTFHNVSPDNNVEELSSLFLKNNDDFKVIKMLYRLDSGLYNAFVKK